MKILLRHWVTRSALPVLLMAMAGLASAQGVTDTLWRVSKAENGTRYLTYSTQATVLGKQVPQTVTFFCNPVHTRTEKGALGIEVQFNQVATLKSFPFDAFEGPDALAHGKKLLRLTLTRPDKPNTRVNMDVNGWTPGDNQFSFGIAAQSQAPNSTERAVLQALATDAETLQVTISHPRNPTIKLEIQVPVAAQRGEFKALLAGLK